MNELQTEQKQDVSIFSNEEDLLRIEKILQNDEEVKKVKEEITEIKDLLINHQKELEEEKLKEEEELKKNIQEEKKQDELLIKEEEELKKQELESFNLLLDTITESGTTEIIEYKDEIIILNNNLVDLFSGGVVFIGFAIGIVLSSLFMRGLYK